MQTDILAATGMTFGGCTGSVTNALKAVAGVGDVTVSVATGEATVRAYLQFSASQVGGAIGGEWGSTSLSYPIRIRFNAMGNLSNCFEVRNHCASGP